jgi:hypothetical protein
MKTLDHPDPYSLEIEMLDPDPQHWNLVIQPTLLCLLALTSRVLQPTGIRYGTWNSRIVRILLLASVLRIRIFPSRIQGQKDSDPGSWIRIK